MAQPPSIRQVSRELLGEVPGWVGKILSPLNTFMSQVTDGLSANLTVNENLAQAWLLVTVTEGEVPNPQAVAKLGPRQAYGLTVERVEVLDGGAAPVAAVGVDWTPTTVQVNNVGRPGVKITKVHGLATGTRATLTLLVKAE